MVESAEGRHAPQAFVLKLGSRKAQLVRPPPLGVGARRTLMSPARASAPGKNAFSTPPAADRILGASPVGGKVFVSPLRQSPKQVCHGVPPAHLVCSRICCQSGRLSLRALLWCKFVSREGVRKDDQHLLGIENFSQATRQGC